MSAPRTGRQDAGTARGLWAKNWTVVVEVRRSTPSPQVRHPIYARSSATTTSKNTSSPTRPNSQACTCTASTNVRGTSAHSPPPSSTHSRANGVSSPRSFTSSSPFRASRTSQTRSDARGNGTERRSRASSCARPCAPPLQRDTRPPYLDGSSFFFKVKFDEPYMMYRGWREITKSLLARGESAKLPKCKMLCPENEGVCQVGKGDQEAPCAV